MASNTKAIVAGIVKNIQDEESIEELELLAKTAGAEVVAKVVQRKTSYDSAFYIGKGKAQEIAEVAKALEANAVIFDDDLTPVQIRNLENLIELQIIDRTTLILDIFAQRAKSKEGKIQVELAQLQHLLPRLTGKGIELSRFGGGIGTRGPGETKLETDKRHIKRRISYLKKELQKIKDSRHLLRSARKFPVISLVGYTNAGKSTLMNALTNAKVSSNDRLFDTLDTTTRLLILPDGRKALLSDTVGFIRKLPHEIVEAFKATLEEIKEADLLLLVADGSSRNFEEEINTVFKVLKDIQADNKPIVIAINKVDKINSSFILPLNSKNTVEISALYKKNLDELLKRICENLSKTRKFAEFLIPYDKLSIVDIIYQNGLIFSKESLPEGVKIQGEIEEFVINKYKNFLI
ncbi:GTPase HflX [Thermovenabulum gondwanense]|uniref:GTPase HflX n=1 Tax=Thermovenabulum gondwanense TaxID=520767 RepID=A0A161RBF0_9FIRM|nr:GTPase HflX [Thermovenabulum gondwanense]KYO68689.1 GTPase HflX [Thermovenabulum gondwanense]